MLTKSNSHHNHSIKIGSYKVINWPFQFLDSAF